MTLEVTYNNKFCLQFTNQVTRSVLGNTKPDLLRKSEDFVFLVRTE